MSEHTNVTTIEPLSKSWTNRAEMLEAVLDASPAFIHVLYGPEFIFEYANEAYHRLVGRRGLIGRPAFEVMPEAAAGGYPSRIAGVMATLEPFHGSELPVMLARTPGGPIEERIIDLVYLPLIEPDGTCKRVLGHGTDVTDNVRARTKAQNERRSAQERLERALSAGQMATWEWDLQTNAVSCSASMRDLFSMPSEALAFSADQGPLMIHPEDRLKHQELVEKSIAQGGSWHTEYRTIRRDGSVVWVEERAHAISDTQDGPAVIVGLVWDVSARKKTEAALQMADERKTKFLATLAHELRNPLAPIRTGLHILQGVPADDERIERTHLIMERQTNHLVRLVDDLLEVSRINRGKVKLRREGLLLSSVLVAAVEGTSPHFEAKRINLQQRITEDAVVNGDRTRLVQVFSNLLENAAKFSGAQGDVRLELDRQGTDAVVTIQDSGCGIDAQHIDTIFEMFSQGPSHDRGGGLGIGLSVVRQLVEMHGGRVMAQSHGSGHGSTFSVRLPLVDAGRAAADRDMMREATLVDVNKQRVLVVDDNRDAADLLALNLKLDGHWVETVYDGFSALQAFERIKPDVVLLDIGMPGMDGYEVARRIRRIDPGAPVRLVALTGFGAAEDRRKSSEAGFNEHLVKPVDSLALSRIGLTPRISSDQ